MTDKRKKKLRREGGFTLTEIMVVLFIISLITFTVGSYAISAARQSQADTTKTRLVQIDAQLDAFYLMANRYPTTQEGLQALVEEPDNFPESAFYPRTGFLKRLPVDGWNRPFVYEMPGSKSRYDYDLFSYGADGVEGGEELDADIGNWD